MATTAMWVHGNAFTPAEVPAGGLVNVNGVGWTDLIGYHQGWGVTFQGRAGHSNIFHVAIPTPVIVNNVRARLKKFFVLFNCRDANEQDGAAGKGANVTQIDIWDGANRIKSLGPFLLYGNYLNRPSLNDALSTFQNPPELRWGLGFSVVVKFHSDNSLVTFGSAGADFEV